MSRFHITEQDKAFLLSLAYGTGIILFWRGIWEGSLEIPILDNAWVSLFLGLLILTLTGWIYREFDVFSVKTNKLMNMLTHVVHEEVKGVRHFLFYFDELANKDRRVPLKNVRKVEQTQVVVEQDGREVFIPLHRISAIHRGGKALWRK